MSSEFMGEDIILATFLNFKVVKKYCQKIQESIVGLKSSNSETLNSHLQQ